jgi:hypothetical protein
MTSEQKLARAVLLRAVQDATPPVIIRNPSDESWDYTERVENWKDARNFLGMFNEDLKFWCEAAVINPSILIKWMINKIQTESMEELNGSESSGSLGDAIVGLQTYC